MKLEFLNPVFNAGLNVTVRLGFKWLSRVKPGDVVGIGPEHPERNFQAQIKAVLSCPISFIPQSILDMEHDLTCRTQSGLIEVLKDAYKQEIDPQTMVTVLIFEQIGEKPELPCSGCGYEGGRKYDGYCFQCACERGIEKNPFE